MSKSGLWTIAGVAVLSLLYLVYLAVSYEAPTGTTTVALPPPALQPVVEEPTPVVRPILPETRLQPEPEPPAPAAADPVVEPPPVEVAVAEPEEEGPESPVIQLPSLNQSDEFVFEGLRAFQNGVALVGLLANDQLIRKFVVFVENISRGEFPQTGLPYRAIGQEMPVTNIDENLFVMDESANARFDKVIETFVEIDTDHAMVLYRTLSPLFQQAYAEIGFRDVNFDDTLRDAITNVLRTTNIVGPFQLVKPSVMYLYADASVENLQEVHKQLIRIGPNNTAQLKVKLRQFLTQL